MKRLSLIIVLSILVLSCTKKRNLHMINIPEGKGIEKAEKFGFKLSMQSYTFHNFSLVETFEKLKELEIHFIEVYPGHTLGGKWGDKKFGFNLTPNEQTELLELANQYGVKIVGCGVYTAQKAEDWEKLFSFAKAMEMEYITCEPEYEHLDLIEDLAIKTGIKVGIHNHPQPSNYWDPKLLLGKIEERSNLIGSCADVGHWYREGFDQIECLQQLKGRIQSLHFKDLDSKKIEQKGKEVYVDFMWGYGLLDIDAMMLELKNQNFKGYITMEYEYSRGNLMQELKDCIFYYDIVADDIF